MNNSQILTLELKVEPSPQIPKTKELFSHSSPEKSEKSDKSLDPIIPLKKDQNEPINEIPLDLITKHPKHDSFDTTSPKPSSLRSTLILPTVKKFIFKLKQAIYFSRISSIDENDKQILNDVSYITETKINVPLWIKNRYMKKIALEALILWKKIDELPVITPYDNIKFVWDLLHFLILNFLFYWIPVEMCFNTFLNTTVTQFFFSLFMVDIIVSMNTAYYVNGFIVKKRSLIYYRYIKNFLFWDLISIIGFGLDHPISGRPSIGISDNAYFILKFIFYLRFKTILSIYNKFIERMNSKFNIKESLIDLVNLIYISIFILHIFACFWYYIAAFYSLEDNPTWVRKMGLSEESIEIKYMYSLYWSSVTIMTVGYGDISPQNSAEVWFTIFAIFLGCGVVAYIISAIGNIMIDISKETQIFKYHLLFII